MNNNSTDPRPYPGNEYPGNEGVPQSRPYGAPPPGYAPPQGQPQAWRQQKPFSNKAIVSIVFAGCGLFLFPLGILLNLVGVGLGLSGMKDTHEQRGTHRGRALAVAGVWTNILVWLLTAAIGVGVAMLFVYAVEQEQTRIVERELDWAQDDMRLIEDRLELYYVENMNSLAPGGPVVKDGWGGGLLPDDHPRVTGELRIEDLVYSDDLMGEPYEYELKVTGSRSATITHKSTGRKLVISDVSKQRSRFEG